MKRRGIRQAGDARVHPGGAGSRGALAVLVGAALAAAVPAGALDLSENPERSWFFGLELGAGLDLDADSRHPEEQLSPGGSPEAYALQGFVMGLYAGFRFNEVIGVQAGWNQSRHAAEKPWRMAWYHLGHLGLRLALPTPTRQTPVLLLGPAAGSFSFGLATPGMEQDNRALVLGGIGGLALEHELLGVGVVAALRLTYAALHRFGFGNGGVLELYRILPDGGEEVVSRKDFGDGRMVHVLMITVALQFEWLLR